MLNGRDICNNQKIPDANWLMDHNHRVARYVEGKVIVESKTSVVNGKVKLFRYIGEPPSFPLQLLSWWTDIETDDVDIASGSTGVIVPSCKYRIEWTFDAAYSDRSVVAFEFRLVDNYPLACEYKNNRVVEERECKVVEMVR
ncbi:protein of unknown function (plasmid) [Cupriavidus taiwanensis]|uniref:Uncharacterized protein n=1 Tax=Cupriavidus taiwanensis TaxID=164546 RepID=A0A375FH64_9BURK|nr:hypothetical protein [Cupriavidus taiwanensis]SOZ71203.1 protein of unknown function [Cupriavidus taiwanensis]SOZ72275.1 protein of unknown function [Cupriavidus taiwanensis]SOZ74570.1 protein of unknown function [Cupriavidus taiwanensis]SPA03491.1 protein of unknown function [Cupriavidus taiwanensis]SPA12639.1 hypothetical protein CBM2625_U30001 [Cupriavidus taiwanensis]